jgi:signal recognition particle subunit SRP54
MLESLSKGIQSLINRFAGTGKATEENVKDALREVRLALLEADVNLGVTRAFIERVKTRAMGKEVIEGVNPGQMMVKVIHDELTQLMGRAWRPSRSSSPREVRRSSCMAGLQGAGKTTTCGKLAALIRKKHEKSVLLVAADLQRPAAVEQFEGARRATRHARPHRDRDAAARRLRARGGAREGRTPRRRHSRHGRTSPRRRRVDERRVADVSRRTQPHEVFLVCDAMTGQDAVNSAKAFNDRLPLTGVISTKLDGDARGGAALFGARSDGQAHPLRAASAKNSTNSTSSIRPEWRIASSAWESVVSLVEKAQEVIDERTARAQAEKMFKGTFSLDDFLRLLQQVRKMGSMKDILGMIPGLGAQMANMPIDEREFSRSEAIILSMTPLERLEPDVLSNSRRARVARGAGVTLEQVNDLMRSFKEMKKQFGELRKMGVFGKLMDPTKGMQKDKEKELMRMQEAGVNLLDMQQVKAWRQFSGQKAREDARKQRKRR